MVDYRYDLSKLLTSNFLSKNQWKDFADSISKVFFRYIYNDIQGLKNIRNVDNLQTRSTSNPVNSTIKIDDKQVNKIELRDGQTAIKYDRDLLLLTSKNYGFNYLSDTITNKDYIIFLKFIGLYLEEKGTISFTDFIGFIKNAVFKVEKLWTNDYYSFRPYDEVPSGQTIFDIRTDHSDSFYPTTHVRVSYDRSVFYFDELEIKDLFFKFAPINIVLESLVAQTRLQVYYQIRSLIRKINSNLYQRFEFFDTGGAIAVTLRSVITPKIQLRALVRKINQNVYAQFDLTG